MTAPARTPIIPTGRKERMTLTGLAGLLAMVGSGFGVMLVRPDVATHAAGVLMVAIPTLGALVGVHVAQHGMSDRAAMQLRLPPQQGPGGPDA